MINADWKVHALAMATTGAIAYILCALFDALFPPYGLLAWLAPASPWPVSGSPLGHVYGFALFTVGGFVLGTIHGGALGFWGGRLKRDE